MQHPDFLLIEALGLERQVIRWREAVSTEAFERIDAKLWKAPRSLGKTGTSCGEQKMISRANACESYATGTRPGLL